MSTVSCPIPVDEAQRIRSVRAYEILDTPPEPEFDALARLASHTFAAPIAVVAMMDSERLWFKSRLGLDIPELDRKVAFCAHAIMRPEQPLVVPDLSQDNRFAHNPLVAQPPHVRFYAGAPIRDSDGRALGTIAVIDAQPRQFSAEQRLALSDLSFLVTTALDARKRSLDLERMASTDHLTGIANRARFEASLQAELARARRTGTPVSLICLDLNGFKEVNDTHGHSAGDEVLVEVTRRIQQLVREGDTFARLGGDEFAIVIQNARDNAVQSLLSRIAPTVAKPIQLSGGNRVQVTTSVGVATTVEEDLSGDNLLARADADLYRDKNSRGVG
ncbi:MAG: GGDEF domain-containing protein [Pseudomonadales bacterium]|uniref:GGDEF domain-containing protein n=1 Tax=unclassified Ketobacter TaxID=2639109 RepID=UPI000C63CB28|nr:MULTISPECIES: sensor domain-containing diguanylate cyclase [unclassified Ketobacter]MAA58790.1 GGDEF domain-containing protein [Pseudomonadales bacterium]MEC8812727.1 sensor domain-containing diguanylate cyclase [Pseudomonadota bacterium]TNC90568.1 MAG: GGDEF domain-containing protein [Alcanivorax sp.]HAG93308.1 sensor domain-containing diguanylate cyclase [Gammaproteobacteria bacterium]MAQ22950.1 GGDEF domain-containing protein [Pseudomonadales bacterium]|tara:strand:- start:513 stop:1508 length:996 start_codon:yes stop_codon:yes gene_type:complete